MVNFVYAIGDRSTGECLLIDPAYAVADLLDVVAADDMRVTGVLATHYHADHVGGSLMGYAIEGIATLLEQVDCPIHLQRDEVPWVRRTTGVSDDHLAAHDAGDTVKVGSIEVSLIHTPGHTPGSQCFHVGGRLISGDTLFLDGCGRTDLPGSNPEDMYYSLQKLAAMPSIHGRLPGPPVLAAVERDDGSDPRQQLRLSPHVRRAVATWPSAANHSTITRRSPISRPPQRPHP